MPVVLLLSFLTGFIVMLVEILAPRLLAPTLGATHVTWAAVLGVFLGALAIGNALGGRWADRHGRWATPMSFVLAALAIAGIQWSAQVLPAGAFDGWPPLLRAVVVVALRFAPAGIALGLVGPGLARAALARAASPGRGLGVVAAAGSLGCVAGALLTGFVGLAHYPIHELMMFAIALCVVGALVSLFMRTAILTARDPVASAGRWTWLAAFSGAVLLVVEIIAGRVVAQRLGSSLDSWTAVIATVLLALALGNWVGGRSADRGTPRAQIGRWMTLGSAVVAAALWTPRILTAMAGPSALSWPVTVFCSTFLAFGAPAFVLGALQPIIVRAALADPSTDGSVAGRLYAAGTFGAVAGALLTGTLLLPALGVPLLVIATSFAMALVAGRVLGRYEIVWLTTLLLVGFVAAAPFESVARAGRAVGLREDLPGRQVADSPYFHLVVEPHVQRWARVQDFDALRALMPFPKLGDRLGLDERAGRAMWRGPMSDEDARTLSALFGRDNASTAQELRRRAKTSMRRLTLDGFVHGFVDLDDATWLEYDYEVLYTALVRALRPNRKRLSCFFIGGGCFTLQRYLLRSQTAGADFVTAELDPAVTEMAYEHLGLKPDRRHRIVHDDARVVLRRTDQKFDLVFGDAFHDLGVPWHLTTQEFATTIHGHLKPGGLYMVNLIDVWSSGRFLRAFLDTVESVFDHVRVLSMAPRDDDRQETFLLVASSAPFTWDGLTDEQGQPLRVVTYSSEDLAALRKRTTPLVLTDDYAPVEHLILPVVRRRDGVRAR